MNALKTNWSLVCVVLLLVVTGFAGIGSSQQTTSATANTTTNTAVQGAQTTKDTVTPAATPTAGRPISPSSATTTNSTRSPTITPDANDVWQNATSIETEHTVNGTLPVGDQDWHVFALKSSGTITVRLAAANQTNMSGFLYSDRHLLDSSYVPPGGQISLTGTATSAGNYYVFVRNEANTTGAYAFDVTVTNSTNATGGIKNRPQATKITSSGSGPGFGLLVGLISTGIGGYLLARAATDSS